MEGIMVAFKICGFLKAKQTVSCKHCDNLKMETAVKITEEKERNQFCLQSMRLKYCKRPVKNVKIGSLAIESDVKTTSAMNSAPACDKSAHHSWY